MSELSPAKWKLLLQELHAFESIAKSLQHNIGNESTMEFLDRIKQLKKALALEEWK